MSDIKLFKLSDSVVSTISSADFSLEKDLQNMFEKNLDKLLGIQFIKTEHDFPDGRIDTLGLDENKCPVIIEYKRSSSANVINQGLFYLDWLLDHKNDFNMLVGRKTGKYEENSVDWSAPRLICVASDFGKYDQHAIRQINRNIELIRYRKFGDDIFLLELAGAETIREDKKSSAISPKDSATSPKDQSKFTKDFNNASKEVQDRYNELEEFLESLGDDVQNKTLKLYIAFKRIRNFACVELSTLKNEIHIYANLNPDDFLLRDGFTRDVRKIGHWGTGDLEINIKSNEDLEEAKPILEKAYHAS